LRELEHVILERARYLKSVGDSSSPAMTEAIANGVEQTVQASRDVAFSNGGVWVPPRSTIHVPRTCTGQAES
jgi:hypothetical protein